ncbi:HAD hydrolase family protein [bacterium]|nr:HAD hydrolase family protein [bacterium]
MGLTVRDETVLEKLKTIRLVIFDVDGVMTDGSAYFNENGMSMKAFSMRDGFGFVMGKFAGLEFAVITGNVVDLLKRRLEKFKIDRIKGGHFRKTGFLQEILDETGIPAEETVYIGDDLFDIPVLKRVGVSMAPNDAHEDVQAMVDAVIETPGGRGVIRDAVEAIVRAQGKYQAVLDSIENDTAGGL